jgi:hypothetical protein
MAKSRAMVSNEDFHDFENYLNTVFFTSHTEYCLLLFLKAWLRYLLSDWIWLHENLVSMQEILSPSLSLSRLMFIAAQHMSPQSISCLLEQCFERHVLSIDHVKFICTEEHVKNNPKRYLSVQKSFIESDKYDSTYFETSQWTLEDADVVEAWNNKIRGKNVPLKIFAQRRLPPPEMIAVGIKQYFQDCPSEDEISFLDRVCAFDVAGATVFSGEWLIKTADGFVVNDVNVGTPHHLPSVYGNAGQAASRHHLIYKKPSDNIGSVFLFGGDDNYYHWIHDVLPRICWYALAPDLHSLKPLVFRVKKRFQQQILAAFGIDASECVSMDYPGVSYADRLVVPLISDQNGTFRPQYGQARRFTHDFFGKRVCEGYATDEWPNLNSGKHIYIKRGDVKRRKVINENEVEKFFANAGFTVIDPARLSVKEQVGVFNGASVVVGAHGAGLVNICFCREKTLVIELAYNTWPSNYFKVISSDRNLNYERFIMKSAPNFSTCKEFHDAFVEKEILESVRLVLTRHGLSTDKQAPMRAWSRKDTFSRQMKYFHGLANMEALLACKDIHRGKRAFVLGNGPSLQISDLDLLENEITFAANKIYLAYDQTDWRPTYWCCSDQFVAKQNAQIIATLPHIKFAAATTTPYISASPYCYIVSGPKVHSDDTYLKEGLDLVSGIHPGVSVVIFMLKLAYWMGINTVYLMGIDFKFTVPEEIVTSERTIDNCLLVSKGEKNHFHPDYRAVGEKWSMPLLAEQRNEFALMRWRYESAGRRIVNVSRKTNLQVFDLIQFDWIL